MTWQAISFYILAALTLFGAYMVVTTRVVTHAALFLAVTFTSIAGLFLVINADFLAAVQILVYAGAIMSVIIFAIMLSEMKEIAGDGPEPFWRRFVSPMWGPLPLLVAGALSASLVAGYVRELAPLVQGLTPGATEVPSTIAIGRELFSTYLVPFEVVSIVLLVALIGAIVLTQKERKEEGKQ